MNPDINLSQFLDNAAMAVTRANELGARAGELRKQYQEAVAAVNKLKDDESAEIETAFNKREKEITKTFDSELDKCNSQLEKAKRQRQKAKNQGIKERIEEETADLKADIKSIQASIKAELKDNQVPSYCNNRLFGALYLPDSVGDVLIIIIVFAIAFFGIPYGIYKLFFDGSTVALIIIYILDVLLFGGIYIGISRHTVMIHNQVLRRVKADMKAIELDRQKIIAITNEIRGDNNESYYDLAKYDDDIAHIKQELADITMKKNEALDTFEHVTKNIIADEITSRNKPAIDEAERRLAMADASYSQVEAERCQAVADLTNNYEVYLGKEFMNSSKLKELSAIVNHGTATNLSEAIEEYNRRNDI